MMMMIMIIIILILIIVIMETQMKLGMSLEQLAGPLLYNLLDMQFNTNHLV